MKEKRFPAAFKCYHNFHKVNSISSDNLHYKMVIHVHSDSTFRRYQKEMRSYVFFTLNLFWCHFTFICFVSCYIQKTGLNDDFSQVQARPVAVISRYALMPPS